MSLGKWHQESVHQRDSSLLPDEVFYTLASALAPEMSTHMVPTHGLYPTVQLIPLTTNSPTEQLNTFRGIEFTLDYKGQGGRYATNLCKIGDIWLQVNSLISL